MVEIQPLALREDVLVYQKQYGYGHHRSYQTKNADKATVREQKHLEALTMISHHRGPKI